MTSARAGKPQGPRNVEETIAMLMGRARRMVFRAAERALAAGGDSMLEWAMLTALVHGGAQTQSDVAEITGQHPAGVSRLLDDMEEKGLVRRKRDTKDRRKVRVVATARGRARWEATAEIVGDAVKSVMRGLDDAERHQLRALLDKMVAAGDDDPHCKHRAAGR